MKIQSKVFGQTKNNEEVILYTVETSKIKIEILNYGCVIKSLYTPNRDGKMENIVLGFDNLSDYEKDNSFTEYNIIEYVQLNDIDAIAINILGLCYISRDGINNPQIFIKNNIEKILKFFSNFSKTEYLSSI